jgi:sugar lactone lactonase YvrE
MDCRVALRAGAVGLVNISLGVLALCCIGFCMTERLGSCLIGVYVVLASVPPLLSGEELFVAKPLTAEHSFTPGIEGPACDRSGNIYAVSFLRTPTIGKITPEGWGEVFVEFADGSLASGIRFDNSGIMFVADYAKHNILRIDPKTRAVTVLAHSDKMSQPNDLAITAEGTLFASDPNWEKSTGQIWRIERNGQLTRIAADMGTTNGIEVSPDGKTLYVNETVQRNVWAFTLHPDGSLTDKRKLIQFPDYGLDGMRCDVGDNLYIARWGKGTVAKISPQGRLLREIDVLGAKPTNVCFGGPDGRTCYVTEVEHGRLVQFRADRPGLEWQLQHR